MIIMCKVMSKLRYFHKALEIFNNIIESRPFNIYFLFLNLYCFQFIFPFFQFLVLCSADVGSEGGSGCLILRQRPNCLLSRPSSHFVAIWPSGSLKSSHKIVTKIVVQIYMEILHCSFSLWAWKDINCEINVS